MASPTIVDLLVATADQLADPHAFSRRSGARTATGDRCDPCSPAATSWCLWGAIESQLGKISHGPLRVVLTTAIEEHLLASLRVRFGLTELDCLAQFSDDRSTTHEDVLELLDYALLSLQPRAKFLSSLSTNAVRA